MLVENRQVNNKYALDKVVPQDASRVIQYANIDSNFSRLIFDGWS